MNREGIAKVREIMAEPISEELFANPVWRIGNLYTCITKEGVEVQFVPNDAQCDVLSKPCSMPSATYLAASAA